MKLKGIPDSGLRRISQRERYMWADFPQKWKDRQAELKEQMDQLEFMSPEWQELNDEHVAISMHFRRLSGVKPDWYETHGEKVYRKFLEAGYFDE